MNIFLKTCGLFSVLLGFIVIIGWHTQTALLIQIFPTFVPMQYNTALGFFLSGLALFALILRKKQLYFIFGFIVTLIGGLTLIEYIFNINVGIDQIFMEHYVTTKTSHPGRMAPNTALSFFIVGIYFILKFFEQNKKYQQLILTLLISTVFALAMVAFAGYILNIESAYGWQKLTRMAIHTSIGFIILSLGILGKQLLSSNKDNFKIIHYPNTKMFALIIFVFLLTIGLVLMHIRTGNLFNQTINNSLKTIQLSKDIKYIDEVLTNSATNAAFTGNLQWLDNYNEQVVLLEKALSDIKKDKDIVEIISSIEEANIELVSIEMKAFDFIKNKQLLNAQSLLLSKEYISYKNKYSDGIHKILNILDNKHTKNIMNYSSEFNKINTLAVILFLLIVVLGVYINKTLKEEKEKVEQQADELNRTKDSLLMAQSLAKIGNWELDLVDNKLFWSDEIFKIFEINKEKFEASYEGFLNVIHPNDRDRVNEAYSLSLENKKPYKIEHRLLMSDGRVKYVEEICSSKFDENGIPLVSEGVVVDITDRKLQEKHLLQQAKLAQMGELIRMIAHQWRQPLSAIASAVTNVKLKIMMNDYDLSKEEDQKEYGKFINKKLNDVESYVTSLSSTIDDFRNFYKTDKKVELVSINEPLQRALKIIKPSLISNNIEVIETCTMCDKKGKIHTNELTQVILNILQNAEDNFIEKSIANPKITISCECSIESTYLLKIFDNGGGIPEDIIDNIFDPYFSTKNEKNGTGLGLYISKTIIEDHHKGSLKVENIDDGARFTVELRII